MKPEAKLIILFLVCLVATVLFLPHEEPTSEQIDREAREAGVLIDNSSMAGV